MLRLYLLLFVIGTFSAIGYSAYAYYTSSQATIATLRENNTKLQMVTETMQNTISTMEVNAKRNEKLNKELSAALQAAEGNLNRLRKRFSEIDINREAIADPEGLAGRINRAVDRLREELKNETSTPIDAPVDSTVAQ